MSQFGQSSPRGQEPRHTGRFTHLASKDSKHPSEVTDDSSDQRGCKCERVPVRGGLDCHVLQLSVT